MASINTKMVYYCTLFTVILVRASLKNVLRFLTSLRISFESFFLEALPQSFLPSSLCLLQNQEVITCTMIHVEHSNITFLLGVDKLTVGFSLLRGDAGCCVTSWLDAPSAVVGSVLANSFSASVCLNSKLILIIS